MSDHRQHGYMMVRPPRREVAAKAATTSAAPSNAQSADRAGAEPRHSVPRTDGLLHRLFHWRDKVN